MFKYIFDDETAHINKDIKGRDFTGSYSTPSSFLFKIGCPWSKISKTDLGNKIFKTLKIVIKESVRFFCLYCLSVLYVNNESRKPKIVKLSIDL